MSSRSLNKVMLIGNLTRDPELRFTPQGTAVCTFGLATNRSWLPEGATERREETEFHRIVAWNKLAELCSQLLSKGRKVYVEGRLSTRTFTGNDGMQRTITEIVIDDMIILDSRKVFEESGGGAFPRVATGNYQNKPNPNTTTTVSAEPVVPTEVAVSTAEPKEEKEAEPTVEEKEITIKKKKRVTKDEKEEKDKPTEEGKSKAELNTDDIPF